MPRPGGEAEKLGNQFEAVWTVDAAIDVFEGRFKSITVEAFGDESLGVEFHLENDDGSLQFHSVKRQKQDGDWSIADLCRPRGANGRSYLGDLLGKQERWLNAETRFISSTGANDLRELAERAATPTNVSEFRGILSEKLRNAFDSQIVALCKGDPDAAFAALKNLEVIPRGHGDLMRSVERRIDGLFDRQASEFQCGEGILGVGRKMAALHGVGKQRPTRFEDVLDPLVQERTLGRMGMAIGRNSDRRQVAHEIFSVTRVKVRSEFHGLDRLYVPQQVLGRRLVSADRGNGGMQDVLMMRQPAGSQVDK
jgi:hypothetical protein